tara:strand:- start:6879 stop:7280 length:402 start_codon:yes stop_codon:yes gene_type:complete
LERPVAEIEMAGESGLPAGTRIDLVAEDAWYDYELGTARLIGDGRNHEAAFVAGLATYWLDSISDEPFFLRVDPWGPHPPYMVGELFLDTIDPASPHLPGNFNLDFADRPDHHARYPDYWTDMLGLEVQAGGG